MTRPNHHPFQPGDTVKLKYGFGAHIRVTRVNRTEIQGRYLTEAQYMTKMRRASDFVYADQPHYDFNDHTLVQPSEEDITTMAKLFQTNDDTPKFGTQIGKTQDGKVVLEIRGKDGEVLAYDPKDLTEVMPYTVRLSQVGHVEVPKDKLQVGDLVITDRGHIASVEDIDTKSRNPTPGVSLRRVVTEEL